MATRWSSEFVVAEHKDLQASAMAVDYNGTYALLYGRRYLAVINLDDPSETLKKVLRQSKYEVGTADWNPTSPKGELCAISSNQRVEVLRWDDGAELTTEQTLRAHTRVVADLHWHFSEPTLLASCSLDTFIHIWDMRDTRRPSQSLSAVVGATHVRWNKQSRYLLASAHEGDIKIWDQRKGTAPVQYISAHLAKIHGLDWNPNSENHLVTSSQDCTVKFFDVLSPRRAENILTFGSPVWRARYTPFGTGLVTVVVSPLRREENSLLLWNTCSQGQGAPVHTFVGHTDVVQEVAWRRQRDGSVDFQLVTWCKDQSLRIWRIEPFLQKLCGHEAQENSDQGTEATDADLLPTAESVTTTIAVETTLSAMPVPEVTEKVLPVADVIVKLPTEEKDTSTNKTENPPLVDPNLTVSSHLVGAEKEGNMASPTQTPKTLQQEFSLTNINIPNVQVDAMDAVRRTCTVTASMHGHVVVLLFTFPPNYPFNAAPSFQLCKGTTVDAAMQAKLVKVLKQTAQQRVRKNKSCLEPCLRQLVLTLEQVAQTDETPGENTVLQPYLQSSQFLEPSSLYGSFKDAYIPFPRTSGATFCSAGYLVCFTRPVFPRRVSVRSDSHSTPRSLSALGPASGAFVAGATMQQLFPGSQASAVSGSASSLSQVSEAPSIASFYFPERQRARSKGRNSASGPSTHRGSTSTKITKASVILYDASGLLFVHRELAEKYKFQAKDISEACQHNASVALSHGRRDLVQVWQLAALAAASPTPPSPAVNAHWSEHDEDSPSSWAAHPFGRNMIESLIMHYAGQSDVQTAAMLSCMFGCRTENQAAYRRKINNKNISRLASGKWCLKPGGSPYHTIHPADTSLDGWNFNLPMLKQNRSNSWSESLDDIKLMGSTATAADAHQELVRLQEIEASHSMLDEKHAELHDCFKRVYAEILYRWNLLEARAQVLKFVNTGPEPHRGVEFLSDCQICSQPARGPSCLFCKRWALQCAICHISVRGSTNFCFVCGHGGHTQHMMTWFANEDQCPTGCGCRCLMETGAVLEP